MAEEEPNEAPQQSAGGGGEEEAGAEQASSPCVIEIHDSTTECEEEARPGRVPAEEKAFTAGLHAFMKEKGTPIERIPHLGFKQIDLWMIYKAVDKYGGYESVTTNRYWKKVYDELGGSPGSTSAATCTRRHYERLVLPFERHIKGEDDKPLPPSKPRKPYKRNLDAKLMKTDGKRKRTLSERDKESESLGQMSSDAARPDEAMLRPHFAVWAANPHPSLSQGKRAGSDFCSPVSGHVVPMPASGSWAAHMASASAGEVISPLEKKKRVAQASLSAPLASQREEKERPSVIHCSQSPARASSSRNCNSSDGSPLPLSSSSSRSPSPLSVSSEDCPARDRPSPCSALPKNSAKAPKEDRSGSSAQTSVEATAQKKDTAPVSPRSVSSSSTKLQVKDSAWRPYHNGAGKCFTQPFHSAASFSTSTSSFSKVIPKSMQPLRPAPIRPSFKLLHGRVLHGDDTLACAKKLSATAQWHYQPEKRERPRAAPQKVLHAQHAVSPSGAAPGLLAACALTNYDKAGRDPRHQLPMHQAFPAHRVRLSQAQLMYHHVPIGPSHPAVLGPAVYPYPYPIPLLNPQVSYTVPPMNHIYPNKL